MLEFYQMNGDDFDVVWRSCPNCEEEYLMPEDAEKCIICGKQLPEEE